MSLGFTSPSWPIGAAEQLAGMAVAHKCDCNSVTEEDVENLRFISLTKLFSAVNPSDNGTILCRLILCTTSIFYKGQSISVFY